MSRNGLLQICALHCPQLGARGHRAQAPKAALQLGRQDAEVLRHVGQPRALDPPPQELCAARLPCASTTLSIGTQV